MLIGLCVRLCPWFACGTRLLRGILAQRCTSPILLNGAPIEIEAYNINGHNYFKLRDIGKAVGFNVYWNADRTERYKSKRVNRTPARHPLEPEMSSRIYSQDQTLPLLMWTL